jgi:cyclic pyranopterin phosphate synthase
MSNTFFKKNVSIVEFLQKPLTKRVWWVTINPVIMKKPTFEYLRISVTDRCNLRCQYCMPEGGIPPLSHDSILRYEEIVSIVEVCSMVGVKRVRITGGEPLVRKGVVNLIASVTKIPGISDVSITTNGHFLSQHAEALFAAGIHRLNISLDSLNHETYSAITRGGSLQTVLDGIMLSKKLGFSPIKLNVVLIPGMNDSEVLGFARFAHQHGVHIRFIERMPFGVATQSQPFVSQQEIIEQVQREFVLTLDSESYGGGPAQVFHLGTGKGRIGFISPRTQPYCHTCNRLRLTANGYLMGCLDSREKTDVRGKSPEEVRDILRILAERKQSVHQMCPSFQSSQGTSLSKIGG